MKNAIKWVLTSQNLWEKENRIWYPSKQDHIKNNTSIRFGSNIRTRVLSQHLVLLSRKLVCKLNGIEIAGVKILEDKGTIASSRS